MGPNFYVYTSVFIAQLSFLIASTCLTWSSPMLLKLSGNNDNPLGRSITPSENSWLASLPTLGAVIGSFSAGLLAKKLGRKTLLIAGTFPFLVFNLVLAWANDIWYFYVCRVSIGIGLGCVFTIIAIYSTEIAQVKNRGILGASTTVFVNLGLLIPYSLGPYIPYFWFHIIMAIFPAISMPLLYFCALESPYFLIRHDRKAARRVLEKIRNADQVDEVLQEMERDLNNDSEGSFKDIINNKGARKAFLLVFFLITFMQFTGTTIVATYTETIFKLSGSKISPDLCPIVIGVAQLITTCIVSSISDKFPRKVMLIFSHIGVALMEIPLGVFFILKNSGTNVDSISVLPLISLVLFVILYNCGIGPVVMISLGELFPLNVKGKATSCLVIYSWLLVTLFNLSFNSLTDFFGTGQIFLFFSVCGFVAAIFAKIFMIETKGKTLEEIQMKLNS